MDKYPGYEISLSRELTLKHFLADDFLGSVHLHGLCITQNKRCPFTLSYHISLFLNNAEDMMSDRLKITSPPRIPTTQIIAGLFTKK
jgi:hypothetical protein